ncbi:MAG: HNH endonuclease [Fastidiosipilaceae bacterium]
MFIKDGVSIERSNLVVHHIDEDIQNNDPENLVTLCMSCHTGLHKTKR